MDIFMVPLFSSKQEELYRSSLGLFRELQRNNVRVVPIFLNAPDAGFRHFLNPLILVRDSRTIFKTLKALAPDAVIGYYVLNAIPLAFFKKILKYSLFVRAAGGDVNLHNRWVHRMFRKFIYSQSDLVFAVSEELAQKVFNESGCQPMWLPEGTDPSFYKELEGRSDLRQKWSLRSDEIVVLTVCNLVKHKGPQVLVEAASLLQKRLKAAVRLVIVGKGPEERNLRQLASNIGLSENVFFLGHRSREELLELYNAADLFVLASYTEGLPAVLLEAMACENVCVSTPVGDVRKVIKEGHNGFLVETGDSAALAEKMREIILLPERQRMEICKQARETIETQFDLRKTTERMLRSLAEVRKCKN